MHRLLDWIDRCDWASQRKEPKPVFATVTGETIFPEGEDPWWLTDTQRKTDKVQAPPQADEDGPVELEEERVDDIEEFTDEDPSSEGDAPQQQADDNDEEQESQPLDRPPSVAWKRLLKNGYSGHFERQRGAHCGMHV